nr:PEP/pyruvate-binding domain-containing protein [Sphingomonas sp. Y57]
MDQIIFLRDADPTLADSIGNKAASLTELIQAGLDVPDGFCIPVDYYRDWRETGDMPPDARASILQAFAGLRAPVAVRSSSPAEDRADASFAGQYETILGVRTPDQLIEAVIACWASASSTAATAYRIEHGTPTDAAMAVLVQELVPASAAGVLFTMHPVSDRIDQVVLNANFGLGDSVVSGRAEPDTFVLDKASGAVIEALIGSKRITTTQVANGVEDLPTPVQMQGQPSLSAAQLRQLADVARALEAHYDQPIDAEWAFEDDTLRMLQARPITTGAQAFYTRFLDQWAGDRHLSDDPDAIWVRGSPISSLPTSPLYYSEMAAFFSDMFPAIAALHGASAAKRKEFRYFNGFTYTNQEFSSTADPAGTVQPIGLTSPAWRSTLKLSAKHPRTLAIWTNIDRYYRNWRTKWGPEIEARRPAYDQATPREVRGFIEFVETQRRARSLYAACGVGFASDLLGLLQHRLKKWAPDAPEEAVGVLTSGTEGSLTHEENLQLWALARRADETPAIASLLAAGDWQKIETLPDSAPFLAAVDDLRRLRPHRGCSDRDLMQERWGDTRRAMLEQVGNLIRLGAAADPATAHDRAAKRRKALEADLEARIGRGVFGALRVRQFRTILRATQRYWIHRDNQRHTFDRYFYELRCAYRAIGRSFAETGVLSEPNDIFFLGKGEIYDHIDGRLTADRTRRRAEWRKQWWTAAVSQEPPALLRGNQPHIVDVDLPEGTDIVGTPGAPGVATGPVRLVRNMQELREVQPGEVVVTQAIDPAWTPVFGIIGGVISEEGGMLSHATVLGREYGLPVIIGARGAALMLNNGEVVLVNGTRGTVHRVEQRETTPAAA